VEERKKRKIFAHYLRTREVSFSKGREDRNRQTLGEGDFPDERLWAENYMCKKKEFIVSEVIRGEQRKKVSFRRERERRHHFHIREKK